MIRRILITGCGGMLGSSVYPHLSKNYIVKATDIDLDESWLNYLDVRDLENARKIAEEFKPDIILHLAALTNLEYCESNPTEAHKTNFIGTKNIAQICKDLNIPMVYISTAGVFDGTSSEPYTEFHKPNPINVYGKSKYEGEKIVETLLNK